jgi:glycerate 2-kinase
MKIQPEKLNSFSILTHNQGENVTRVLAAALNAVDPYEAVNHYFHFDGKKIEVKNKVYDLDDFNRIYLVGAGKASIPMAEAVIELLGARISSGCLITKQGYTQSIASLPECIHVIEASHPIPDTQGVQGTKEIIRITENALPEDLIICVISGGGSALLSAPMPGIKLDDIQLLTSQLLACSATIDEINTIRKHIDLVKGGGLVANSGSANWITLILSDVIGDPLDRIASGPTVPDVSTFQDAIEILNAHNLIDRAPQSIIAFLQRRIKGEISETIKTSHRKFELVNNLIIGNNMLAAKQALDTAQKIGFDTMLLTTFLQGEASQAGKFIASIAQEINRSNQPLHRPACLIAGGETTVTLRGKGLGGRNQELALGGVEAVSGLENIMLITLATDGGDGPTEAAGAVVTGYTFERSQILGMHPRDYLMNNDSYHFFEALDDLLVPGPTFTNVGDLTFLFAF